MVAELHTGHGAAGLCAVEGGRRAETDRCDKRAPIGEAAALNGSNGRRDSPSFVVLHEPVARHVGTWDS